MLEDFIDDYGGAMARPMEPQDAVLERVEVFLGRFIAYPNAEARVAHTSGSRTPT
jgi:hypothetical protein